MRQVIQLENITIFQSELYKTNSIVVENEDCVIVVDPTWLPLEVEAIKQYVYEIKGNRPLYLLFTHSDWDHIIGYGAFTDAITIGSVEMDKLDSKEEILEQILEFDHKYYLDRDYSIAFPKLERTIRHDGERIQVGDTTLTFYQAKGHTADGIITVVEPLGLLVAGDYFSDVEFPYIYHNSFEYEKTVEKVEEIMKKHTIKILVPGHGNIAYTKEEILERKQSSLLYIKGLREGIQHDKSENELEELIKGYQYPKGMKTFQLDNISLMEKELKRN